MTSEHFYSCALRFARSRCMWILWRLQQKHTNDLWWRTCTRPSAHAAGLRVRGRVPHLWSQRRVGLRAKLRQRHRPLRAGLRLGSGGACVVQCVANGPVCIGGAKGCRATTTTTTTAITTTTITTTITIPPPPPPRFCKGTFSHLFFTPPHHTTSKRLTGGGGDRCRSCAATRVRT